MKDSNRGWVKPNIIEEQKGITRRILNHWRIQGRVIEGHHWRKSKGVIFWHYEHLDDSLESN